MARAFGTRIKKAEFHWVSVLGSADRGVGVLCRLCGCFVLFCVGLIDLHRILRAFGLGKIFEGVLDGRW